MPVLRTDAPPGPDEPATVLLISALEDDYASLRNILVRSNWRLLRTSCCREATEFARGVDVPVVICERDLPDGSWKAVIEGLSEVPRTPNVIVASGLADDLLWAEVLNLGAYDLLQKPFVRSEVWRVAFLAWHDWKRRCGQTSMAPAAGAAA